ADIYPDLNEVIEEHVTEEGRTLLDRLHNMTTVEAVVRLFRRDMGDMLDAPLEQILSTPAVQRVFDEIKLGATVPTPPVLIVQAVHDLLIDVHDIDELADTYKSGGASVTYHRDMFSEHMLLHPLSAPMTLRWLIDRFNGKPLSEHMVRTKWPTLLNPMMHPLSAPMTLRWLIDRFNGKPLSEHMVRTKWPTLLNPM
ncbi:lipase family protein, partial [Mycolicibacter minnesotensis]|uniref:lipase family protein n=1 Tax=Mycolicibacter minnesotensis TaxID=1118379 RepID=UPI0021F2804F